MLFDATSPAEKALIYERTTVSILSNFAILIFRNTVIFNALHILCYFIIKYV